MDADQFRRLEAEFTAFLDRFGDCFSRKDTRAHLGVYMRGQLSDLPEKSAEPIALELVLHRGRCKSSSASSSGTKTGCAIERLATI